MANKIIGISYYNWLLIEGKGKYHWWCSSKMDAYSNFSYLIPHLFEEGLLLYQLLNDSFMVFNQYQCKYGDCNNYFFYDK